ncbi:MAG: SlyX family protein [Sphaerochaeta sp.]|jgi:uncharacterized coiled-coil protein SlyX|nr:SlyX family protein [Sphaerochaeta sp.]MDX9916065.1 SlyX family protein [Sphaerochaeta sp.]
MDDRLMKMEVKIAYMEEAIATLDSVVREQNGQIALLQHRLMAMERRFASLLEEGGDGLPHQEKPPHY